MNEKTVRLQRLVADGFSIVDVTSDEDSIAATLRRGDDVVRLKFFKSEAGDLLQLH